MEQFKADYPGWKHVFGYTDDPSGENVHTMIARKDNGESRLYLRFEQEEFVLSRVSHVTPTGVMITVDLVDDEKVVVVESDSKQTVLKSYNVSEQGMEYEGYELVRPPVPHYEYSFWEANWDRARGGIPPAVHDGSLPGKEPESVVKCRREQAVMFLACVQKRTPRYTTTYNGPKTKPENRVGIQHLTCSQLYDECLLALILSYQKGSKVPTGA